MSLPLSTLLAVWVGWRGISARQCVGQTRDLAAQVQHIRSPTEDIRIGLEGDNLAL